MAENGNVNFVLGKALSVLPETQLFEPVRNLLHRRPSTDLMLSVLDRQVGEFTNTRQDRVVVLAVRPLQAFYAMTSSALTISACGKVIPSAFAVLRFRTSLNFVGCSTGRSAGFAPFSILSV